ncbi:hypothetical protein [Streptomyces sp. NPDC047974]|uniref:hypothetical protein n=1 Tax=Streptomyces sp. NPDC047974 TaxID=3154343 RepID=UPI0033E8D439
MTEPTPDFIQEKRSELDPHDPRLALEKLCIERGYETQWSWLQPDLRFRVGFPNGRSKRWQGISARSAEAYLSIDLPPFTYLGEFDAVHFRDRNIIEAYVLTDAPPHRLFPGIRRIGHTQLELVEPDEDGDIERQTAEVRIGINDAWVLDFSPSADRPDMKISIGSASREFAILSERHRRRGYLRDRDREALPNGLGRFTSIQISGLGASRHDEALEMLKRVTDSVFFELDLRYGTAPELAPSESKSRSYLRTRPEREAVQGSPRNPQNQYPEKALSLYRYGRGASGIPLLEYLAYYQVLEYFFPSYSHRDTLTKLRNELLDPRFRPDDDTNLVRIVNIASGAGKGYGSESEQLRSTIGGCVTQEQVHSFITANDALVEHFSGKQKIKSVPVLNLDDAHNDFITAVANRVYGIRCRIVHAKEEGGRTGVDLLLPFSKEAEALGPDIELVKFLAQKVLIAGASRLRV